MKKIEELYNLGFALLWLKPKSKMPVENGWTKKSRSSLDDLRASYRKGMNIGTRLGGISRVDSRGYLAVVDCDVKGPDRKYGDQMRDALKAAWPELMDAGGPIVLSGRGGGSCHLYIVTKDPVKPKRILQSPDRVAVHMPSVSAKKRDIDEIGLEMTEKGFRSRPAWEVSLMGNGQQVVLPPSIHPDSGKPYEWAGFEPPRVQDFPLLEIPIAFAGAEKTHEERGFRFDFVPDSVDLERLAECDRDMIVSGHGVDDRSSALYFAAGAMVKAGFSDGQIASVLCDSKNFLGRVAFDHAKTDDLIRAGEWLYRYTIAPARRENDAKAAFAVELAKPVHKSDDEQLLEEIEQTAERKWIFELDRTDIRSGAKVKITLKNVLLILKNAVAANVFVYNAFTGDELHGCSTPWGEPKNAPIRDIDLLNIKVWIAERYEFEPPTKLVSEAVSIIARENSFHPVRDYLSGLKWDGKPRIDTWLQDYCSAVGPDEYLRAIGRKTLVALVARVTEPGVKYDQVLVLEGKQGMRKSTTIKVLSGDAWFTDQEISVRDKDSVMTIQGKWIVELGELSVLRRAELEALKSFISRPTDRIRLPYGHRTEEFPRQGIFIGSTNAEEYLQDRSGHRRFWPVAVGECFPEKLAEVRDQLFAEARAYFEKGENLYLDQSLAAEQAIEAQEDRETADPLLERVSKWLSVQDALEPRKREARIDEILMSDALDWPPFMLSVGTPPDPHRVGSILRKLGFVKTVRRVGRTRSKVWTRSG